MSRPKKKSARRSLLTIRFTAPELRALKQKARYAEKPVRDYVRDSVLDLDEQRK